jgi:hypothetical protein
MPSGSFYMCNLMPLLGVQTRKVMADGGMLVVKVQFGGFDDFTNFFRGAFSDMWRCLYEARPRLSNNLDLDNAATVTPPMLMTPLFKASETLLSFH